MRSVAAAAPATTPRPTRLASALRLAMLGLALGGMAAPVWAQAPAAASPPRAFQVPGGALADALGRFARAAGINLVYDPALVAGANSPGLNGSHTVASGLAALLAGTGLEAVSQPGGGYALRKAPVAAPAAPAATQARPAVAPAESTLGTVLVSARADGRTEGTAAYASQGSAAATGLTLSARETPQTVSVVTRAQIDDQKLETIEEALTRSPGIHLDKSWGSNRPVFYSRGFAVSNMTYDGLPISLDGYAFDVIASADLAIYDSVEVVRGSTGLMQGSGNPSAAINLVRKRPTRTLQGYAELQAGSWNNRRVEADVSGPINASGSLRGRLVGAHQNKDTFVDHIGEKKSVFYGAVEADLTPRTLLTVSANVQNSKKGNSWGGLPTYADGGDIGLPTSTNLGASWARHDTDNTTYVMDLRHELEGGWQLRGSLMRIDGTMDFAGTWGGGSVDRATGSGFIIWPPGFYYYTDKQTSLNVGASGPFEWLGRRHELSVGASWRSEDYVPWGTSAGDMVMVDNLFTWDPTRVPVVDPGVLPDGGWDAKTKESGLYAAGRFQVADSLHLIAGARLMNWKQTSMADPVGYKVKNELVPYGGLVWDLNDHYSLYASYADILKPQQVYDVHGKLIDPVQGKSYEAGVKGEWLGGRLQASAAVFLIDQEGLPVDDLSTTNPCPPYNLWGHCQIGEGLVRSEGVELGVSGEVSKGLELSAGYTYNRSRAEEKSAQDWKQASTNLPKHTLRLNASYRLSEAWKFGASLRSQSGIFMQGVSGGVPYRITQDAYTLADLMVSWTFQPRTSLQFNLNNVFDKRYYQSISSPSSGNHYGEPRSLLVTLNHKF